MPPVRDPDRPAPTPGLAIVLAGGVGRRLGLVDKPALRHGGRQLIDVALAAVAPAVTVVVGPHRDLPPGILQTREHPPGGGPAAAVVAGVRRLLQWWAAESEALEPGPDLVAVLASDLPGIDRATMTALAALLDDPATIGAVLTDPGGRRQYLVGVWRWDALAAAVQARASWDGARVSDLLDPLVGATLAVSAGVSADVDVPADLIAWDIALPESPPVDNGS